MASITLPRTARRAAGLALACLVAAGHAHATPITPTRDDEVIDVLPATAGTTGTRAEERRLREQLARRPRDAALALAVAKHEMAKAHRLGDPRFAGRALAAVAAWNDDPQAPADVLLMRATVQQYLHEFDTAAATLQGLLGRRGGGAGPQAWLTLATIRRVQGRYAESDAACAQVAAAGAMLHGAACAAENRALRGDFDRARASLEGLLATPRLDRATRAWLTTTLAELEMRAGRSAAADAGFRAALEAQPDDYTRLAYADFLIDQKRPAKALALLKDEPRSDAVLLRLAIAGAQAGSPGAAADAAEMRERIALANERPQTRRLHGREQAMFALAIEHRPEAALELARGNVAHQREPLDLLVFTRAALAGGNEEARAEARQLAARIGLRDARLEPQP